MASKDPKLALAGTVKEGTLGTGADEEGLVDFYQSYFDRHPIYNDEKWQLYHAMGGRKASVWSLVKASFTAFPRWNNKGIPSSSGRHRTDPWMIGGVLVFDQKGNLVYAMEETLGEEFSMDRLERAIRAARTLNEVGDVHPEEESGSNKNKSDSNS